jgi:cyclic nucleotide-binding protein/MFS transporter
MFEAVRRRIVSSAVACAVNLRSPNLRRAQASFGLMWAGEWAATVAISVVAFSQGGAAAVGLVGVARMVPAATVAPFAAIVADRVRRESVLAGVGVGRALALGVAAGFSGAGGPVALVYVALVAATVAQTVFRPAHSALLPTLCATPVELTSANVVRGLLDAVATLTGPLVAALLLEIRGPSAVFVFAAAASALAASLIVHVRYEAPPSVSGAGRIAPLREAIEGMRTIASDGALALLTGLGALQTFTRGALTVFSVVLAIDVLGSGQEGVGELMAAVGAGAVVGSLSTALLVGRGGLARWFGIGVALWGAPLVVISMVSRLSVAIVMLAIVGLGNALVDVGGFTLLARLTHDDVLARVFAGFEGILTLGVAAGSIIASVLIGALGLRPALATVGCIAPIGVVACWRGLATLDRRMRVRDVDIDLLRLLPMFQPLQTVTLEQLAAALIRTDLPAGATVFEQGDEGDCFYVIERGEVEVIGDGQAIRTLGPGDGFGEIALLRECRRTASVRATTALTLCTLSRRVFVAAVAGYSRSAAVADGLISDHLNRFRPRDS